MRRVAGAALHFGRVSFQPFSSYGEQHGENERAENQSDQAEGEQAAHRAEEGDDERNIGGAADQQRLEKIVGRIDEEHVQASISVDFAGRLLVAFGPVEVLPIKRNIAMATLRSG